MADYYPLIAKAVAGLPSSTPEARSAIYQRARSALLGQLRRLEPPIPESDVERESAALEVAIARLEADLAPPPQVEQPPRCASRRASNMPFLPRQRKPRRPRRARLSRRSPKRRRSEAPHLAEEPREEAQGAPRRLACRRAARHRSGRRRAGAPSPTARPQTGAAAGVLQAAAGQARAVYAAGKTGWFSRAAHARVRPGASPTVRPPLFPPPPGSAPVADDRFEARPASSPAAEAADASAA